MMIISVSKEEMPTMKLFDSQIRLKVLVEEELITEQQKKEILMAYTKILLTKQSLEYIIDGFNNIIVERLCKNTYGFSEDKSNVIGDYIISMYNIFALKYLEQRGNLVWPTN